MSPAQHPSGRPPSIYGNQFASSNSTANRFLGSTQRPWMTNVGPLSPSTPSYPRNPVNFQAKHPRTSSRQSTTSSTTTQPPTRIETSDHQSTAHASDSTVARPTQTGPVSPVTPGTGHSENDLQPSAAKVARLDNAVPTASFPTPEPSNPSLAGPVAAVTERAVSSSKDVPASLPGAGAQPPVNIKWKGATTATPTPTSLSPVVVANSPPQPQSQPPSQSQSRHSSPPHKSHRIWEHARERLKTFLVQSPRTHTLSETVELPRVRILQDACGAEDMFYLALHQIFCLNSTDPSQLREVADYGIVPNLGFDVIAQLLVDNKRLSKEFLQWSIEYPMPFQILLLSDDYKKALKQVSHCLSTISNHWPVFEREVRARGHPPQVDELVVRLGVESPVFQTIVFTAISRRLFGTREELFKACIVLFEEDQRTYNQRSTFSADVRRQAMFNYFGRYRQLCASHGMLAVPDSFRDQTTSAPRATSSSAQAPTSIMNSPKTPLQQNHTQHRASTSIPRQLPSNPHPNTHPGGPRPLPTTLRHVSPNLAPNAGQQQQQQVLHQNIALPTGNIQHAQAHQQQLYPSQFHGSFPPPSQYVVASQSTIPASPAPPNPMLPPNIQMQSSFPPVRQSSNGIDASTFPHPQYFSSVIAANMVPTSSSPVQSPYPTTQPPPNSRGQGQHPLHPQGHLQPAPSVHFPMPTQPSGTLFTMYPQMPTQALHPHLAPSLPGQHNPNPEPPDVIQYFSGFSVVPQRLPPNRSSFTWKFTVPREILRLRPKLVRRPNNGGFISLLSDGNMSFRLRCIKYPGSQDVDSIATWSQAESHWPNVVYIHVNNREVYRSPKAKNSPISINSYLIDGSNEIRVNVLHSKQRCAADTSYAVAVEILQVKSPESFRKLVKKLPAQETRQQILARLSSSNANDDDLMIMDDFISINLRDPFTARIFDIPVRGSLCTHKECFDLSTFLQTLTAKPLAEKHKIYVRCPICRKDARPELLVIDEFLGEVRDSLSKENKLETAKAIRVKSDGSWSTVLDTENDSRTAGRKRDRASFESDHVKNEDRPSTSTPRGTSAPEVIELD